MTTRRRSASGGAQPPSGFPKRLTLRDGSQVTLRPMTSRDSKALLAFFLLVPEEDRRYLKDDVTSPELLDRWARELDYARVLPLLAEIGGRIVADASLHRGHRPARPRVGELRVVVDPAFRNKGLATTMMRELIAIARREGLERVIFRLAVDAEDAAIRAAERLGFQGVAEFFHHEKDHAGDPFDLLVMELPLGEP